MIYGSNASHEHRRRHHRLRGLGRHESRNAQNALSRRGASAPRYFSLISIVLPCWSTAQRPSIIFPSCDGRFGAPHRDLSTAPTLCSLNLLAIDELGCGFPLGFPDENNVNSSPYLGQIRRFCQYPLTSVYSASSFRVATRVYAGTIIVKPSILGLPAALIKS